MVDDLIDCVLFNRPSPLRYIRGGWTSRARKRLGFTSKTLVKFGLVLSELFKTVRFKLAALCRSFLWWYMTSDGNESKSILDCFDKTNNFHLERFFIRGYLEGQIARAKQLIIHAAHQTYPRMCLVPGVIFCSLEGRAMRALTFAYDLGLG